MARGKREWVLKKWVLPIKMGSSKLRGAGVFVAIYYKEQARRARVREVEKYRNGCLHFVWRLRVGIVVDVYASRGIRISFLINNRYSCRIRRVWFALPALFALLIVKKITFYEIECTH